FSALVGQILPSLVRRRPVEIAPFRVDVEVAPLRAADGVHGGLRAGGRSLTDAKSLIHRACGGRGSSTYRLANLGNLARGDRVGVDETNALGDCRPLGSIPAVRRLLYGIAIDLNQASLAELELLPGIGPQTARRIVGWRDGRRRFSSIEE